MRENETEEALVGAGEQQMYVDGVPMNDLRLCPQCEVRFVIKGYCTPCVQFNEYMESKRLREARYLTSAERINAGVSLYPESDDCDPPVTALLVVLACEATTAVLLVIGAWFALKWGIEVLLRWSA